MLNSASSSTLCLSYFLAPARFTSMPPLQLTTSMAELPRSPKAAALLHLRPQSPLRAERMYAGEHLSGVLERQCWCVPVAAGAGA